MQTTSFKNLDINTETKGKLPSLPFVDLKKEILGDEYELSISFVTPKKMATLSQTYKGDPTHMNILSFPLSENSGEIVMNMAQIKKEAPDFDRSAEKHLKYLVIHGMLHLAHFVHGSKMESEEKRLMKLFGF